MFTDGQIIKGSGSCSGYITTVTYNAWGKQRQVFQEKLT